MSISLLLLVGCPFGAGTAAPAAEIDDVGEDSSSAIGEEELDVDTARSGIHAFASKVSTTHDITFDTWSGTISLSEGELVGLGIAIEMASVRADVDRLTSHLASDDFFDVETYPQADFQASAVVAEAGEGGTTHAVSGALTICGTTKQVTFPATVAVGDPEVSATAAFTLDRRDFGLTNPGQEDDPILDEVQMSIELVAAR